MHSSSCTRGDNICFHIYIFHKLFIFILEKRCSRKIKLFIQEINHSCINQNRLGRLPCLYLSPNYCSLCCRNAETQTLYQKLTLAANSWSMLICILWLVNCLPLQKSHFSFLLSRDICSRNGKEKNTLWQKSHLPFLLPLCLPPFHNGRVFFVSPLDRTLFVVISINKWNVCSLSIK